MTKVVGPGDWESVVTVKPEVEEGWRGAFLEEEGEFRKKGVLVVVVAVVLVVVVVVVVVDCKVVELVGNCLDVDEEEEEEDFLAPPFTMNCLLDFVRFWAFKE